MDLLLCENGITLVIIPETAWYFSVMGRVQLSIYSFHKCLLPAYYVLLVLICFWLDKALLQISSPTFSFVSFEKWLKRTCWSIGFTWITFVCKRYNFFGPLLLQSLLVSRLQRNKSIMSMSNKIIDLLFPLHWQHWWARSHKGAHTRNAPNAASVCHFLWNERSV